mmetsp:Transcript_8722/g.14797  ORF Transcript_8722/g.14797 Transcript_8722/m.14797 type:complete len:114 (+) Transcript_8722:1315-1656(+)
MFRGARQGSDMLAILQDCGHLVFTDLSLLMLLEFWVLTLTASLEQVFRSQYNLQLTLECVRVFMIRNDLVKNPLKLGRAELEKEGLKGRDLRKYADEQMKKMGDSKDVDFDVY